MNAKKCDRCEKFYDPYKPSADHKYSNMIIFAEDKESFRGLMDISYSEIRQFELCQECMKDAVEFMQEKLP